MVLLQSANHRFQCGDGLQRPIEFAQGERGFLLRQLIGRNLAKHLPCAVKRMLCHPEVTIEWGTFAQNPRAVAMVQKLRVLSSKLSQRFSSAWLTLGRFTGRDTEPSQDFLVRCSELQHRCREITAVHISIAGIKLID